MRPTVTADRDRPRVLLVDPEEPARAVTGQALLDGGCEVVAAVPSYAQALVSSRRDHPTVVVTELYGGTVLTPAQYVILLSATLPTRGEIADWGLWGALVKGDPRRLLDLVHAAHAAVTSRA
jgi:hypothetical protein